MIVKYTIQDSVFPGFEHMVVRVTKIRGTFIEKPILLAKDYDTAATHAEYLNRSLQGEARVATV